MSHLFYTLGPGQQCQALISPSQRRFWVNKKAELQYECMHSLQFTNACMEKEHIMRTRTSNEGGTVEPSNLKVFQLLF